MSVLIRGMEMPKNCGECPFIFTSWGIEYYCHLAESSTSAEYVGREKMTNCPLIELSPHGNLKDESDIISLIEVMFCKDKDGMEHALQCVKDAPTVIEAEGSEE